MSHSFSAVKGLVAGWPRALWERSQCKEDKKVRGGFSCSRITRVHAVSHPSSSRLTETCVCQALGKNLSPGAGPLKSSWSGDQGRRGTDRSPCGVTAVGGGKGEGGMHRKGGAKQDLGAGPPTSHAICGGLGALDAKFT